MILTNDAEAARWERLATTRKGENFRMRRFFAQVLPTLFRAYPSTPSYGYRPNPAIAAIVSIVTIIITIIIIIIGSLFA